MTPLSERGRTVLLEDIASVGVAILVEVVVDRGMSGGDFLQGHYFVQSVYRKIVLKEAVGAEAENGVTSAHQLPTSIGPVCFGLCALGGTNFSIR